MSETELTQEQARAALNRRVQGYRHRVQAAAIKLLGPYVDPDYGTLPPDWLTTDWVGYALEYAGPRTEGDIVWGRDDDRRILTDVLRAIALYDPQWSEYGTLRGHVVSETQDQLHYDLSPCLHWLAEHDALAESVQAQILYGPSAYRTLAGAIRYVEALWLGRVVDYVLEAFLPPLDEDAD